ncbi:MAG: DUF1868 domain-containing protein, partial [Pseudomonadota bacterium]
KFTSSGAVLGFPGNTFLCHLVEGSQHHDAVSRYQDALATSPWAAYFTFLPKASFHMTIFCGVSGAPLGSDGWPEGFEPATSLDDITTEYLRRLRDVQAPDTFNVRIVGAYPNNLLVTGENVAEETALRHMRDRLRDLTGLDRPDQDTYQFHISVGYQTTWMPEAAALELVEYTAACFARHIAPLPALSLGAVEFCRFENMHRFDPICQVGPDGPFNLD